MNDATDLISVSVPARVVPVGRLQEMLAYAQEFEITGDADKAAIASAEYNELRAFLKRLKAEYEYDAEPLEEAIRRLRSRYKPALDLIEKASKLFNDKLAEYVDQERAAEREAQIRARESHRLEQERLAHEAAKREQQGQEEALKLRAAAAAEAQAGNQTSAAELQRRAERAEMAGQQDAQQLLEQLQLSAPAEVAPADKPGGIVARKSLEIEGIDVAETALAVCEGRVPARALKHDLVWLRQYFTSMGEEGKVPGVVAHWRTTVASRGKR